MTTTDNISKLTPEQFDALVRKYMIAKFEAHAAGETGGLPIEQASDDDRHSAEFWLAFRNDILDRKHIGTVIADYLNYETSDMPYIYDIIRSAITGA